MSEARTGVYPNEPSLHHRPRHCHHLRPGRDLPLDRALRRRRDESRCVTCRPLLRIGSALTHGSRYFLAGCFRRTDFAGGWVIVVLVSTVIGTLIGAVAGFYSGRVDSLLSGYVFNVFLAFPGLLLAIGWLLFWALVE